MAALTTIAIAGAAVAAAGSTANIISGANRAKKAQKALDNFKRQELKNVTEGMRVSTLGAELQTQEAQRRFATSVDALRSGGVRGLVGGLGRQEQIQQAGQQQIAADLDRQQQQIEQMAAQDEANIRNMQEQRESSAIAGLGMEVAAGKNQVSQGISGLAQAGLTAATAGIGAGAGEAAGAANTAATAGRAGIDAGAGVIKASEYVGSTAQTYNMAKQAAGAAFSAPKQKQGVYVAEPGIFGGNPYNL